MSPHEWLDKTGRTAASIAKEIGVAVSTVTRPVNGERYPTFTIMLEFYKLSGGLISLGDWIKMFEGRYRRGESIPSARTQPNLSATQREPVKPARKPVPFAGKEKHRPAGRPRRQAATKRAERRGDQDGKEAT